MFWTSRAHMPLGIQWYQHKQNHKVRQTTKEPHLSIIRHRSLFGHICTNARQSGCYEDVDGLTPGRPEETTGTSSCNMVQDYTEYLKSKHLSLNETIDMAQNQPLCRYCLALRIPSGACQKRQKTDLTNSLSTFPL